MDRNEQIKAVGLFSGGLDSMLAIRVVTEQGIRVTALHFRTGFSYLERNRTIGQETGPTQVERAAALLNVPLEVIDLADEYISVVLHPRYGYGSGMNPCVDCRIFLLRRAKDWMEEHGYHFVFTGEVVGQRPKSQMRPTLKTVERESGLQNYLLRPLSAKILPPTEPEQRGWVDREKLYGISGRGRKEQITLAAQLRIDDYPQPSGGCCYLVDQTYSRRLRDLLAHEGEESLNVERAQLLAVGRHLRLPSGCKIVVGRREQENNYLATCDVAGVLLTTPQHPGPTTLIPGAPTRDEIEMAARITAGYSDGWDEPAVPVRVSKGPTGVLTVEPLDKEEIRTLMV